MPVVEYPKVEINFTPPSHVLKIVENAKEEEGSDWSEDEPVYVLKDGKKGTYIMRDQKYFLAETVKEKRKKRLRKKLTTKKKEEEHGDFKEVSVITFFPKFVSSVTTYHLKESGWYNSIDKDCCGKIVFFFAFFFSF